MEYINLALAFGGAVYTMGYFMCHGNGKKNLYFVCSFILLLVGIVQTFELVGIQSNDYFGSLVIFLLLFIPIWHTRVDWSKKQSCT